MAGPLNNLLVTAELVALGQKDTLDRLDEKCRNGKWPVVDLAMRRDRHADLQLIVGLLRLIDEAGVTREELGDWLREKRAARETAP